MSGSQRSMMRRKRDRRPVADPRNRRNLEESRQLVQVRGVRGAQIAEVQPGFIAVLELVAGSNESIAGMIELRSLDADRLVFGSGLEVNRQVASRVAADVVHDACLTAFRAGDGGHQQRRRVEQRPERSDPGLIVVTRPEKGQDWVSQVT